MTTHFDEAVSSTAEFADKIFDAVRGAAQVQALYLGDRLGRRRVHDRHVLRRGHAEAASVGTRFRVLLLPRDHAAAHPRRIRLRLGRGSRRARDATGSAHRSTDRDGRRGQ